jgi:hypothetical protein
VRKRATGLRARVCWAAYCTTGPQRVEKCALGRGERGSVAGLASFAEQEQELAGPRQMAFGRMHSWFFELVLSFSEVFFYMSHIILSL